MMPKATCPKCKQEAELDKVLTAQANQNVIYECPHCHFLQRNIHTSKG